MGDFMQRVPRTKLTVGDVALFSHMAADSNAFDDLPAEEQAECLRALRCAVSYVLNYTGLSSLIDEMHDISDLEYAVLTVAAEMLDNRQMTEQYTGQNPTVIQILSMHSTNLLPSV